MMYSKDIVINCPYCEADIEVNRLAVSTQCPFCDKKFNIEEGKKAHEILMKKSNSRTSENFKYCRECGRKLAFDAKYCDWCGVKLI